MRGLESGQSLDLVSTREDAQVFANIFEVDVEDLQILHLFQYVKKVESQQKGTDYFLSLRLYLEDLVENLLWQHLDDPDRFADVLSTIAPLLVDETEKDPLRSLSLSTTYSSTRSGGMSQRINVSSLKSFGRRRPKP